MPETVYQPGQSALGRFTSLRFYQNGTGTCINHPSLIMIELAHFRNHLLTYVLTAVLCLMTTGERIKSCPQPSFQARIQSITCKTFTPWAEWTRGEIRTPVGEMSTAHMYICGHTARRSEVWLKNLGRWRWRCLKGKLKRMWVFSFFCHSLWCSLRSTEGEALGCHWLERPRLLSAHKTSHCTSADCI